ncbi:hypothetical protein NEOLEDRAFT_1074647 [Neolentinus lepideus HHB14362 ss-1]|uniref:Uncharacterized protein n=1 Tax=Neolentinus lepideus HHB14362 ss-1 TaxID=1314782 RepID=A0A165PDW7_9AGAM|nr:hypothetical protein NEOLEDRAFT_1074647 [Neolentinus lepideus HHB14362 ss-1]
MVFPSTGRQILSAFIHFAGVSILAHCLSRRVSIEHLTSISGFMQLSWPRLLIILVFLDSWLFLFTGGIIIFGAGMELSGTVCSLGIDICIAFYATSKIFIYWFLIEKVFLVWTPGANAKRMKSPVYIGCLVMLSLYTVVVIIMVLGRVSFFRDDGACSIGLHPYASGTLVAYDLFINLVLNGLFLWPLLRSRFMNPTIKKVATRTLCASVVALTTSTVNMLVLTLMHGRQLGWVCLGSCGTDVVFNAIVLFWITSGAGAGSTGNVSTGRDRAKANQPVGVAISAYPPTSPMYPARDSKVNSPRSPGAGFDYVPRENEEHASPSNVTFIAQGADELQVDRRRVYMGTRTRSRLGSILDFFRRSNDRGEEHSLQVRVTIIGEMCCGYKIRHLE